MSTPVSREALEAAWKNMRMRPCLGHWPQDFDQVMADPVRSQLVTLEARHRARAGELPFPVMRRLASLPMLSAPAFFDHKRAAAGDRDD